MDIFDLIEKNLKDIELNIATTRLCIEQAEEKLSELRANLNPGIDTTVEVVR